jgi:hypothetical protein
MYINKNSRSKSSGRSSFATLPHCVLCVCAFKAQPLVLTKTPTLRLIVLIIFILNHTGILA